MRKNSETRDITKLKKITVSPIGLVVVLVLAGLIAALVYSADKNPMPEPPASLPGAQRPEIHASSTAGLINGLNGMYLGPDKRSYSSSSEFTVYLRENSGQTPVNAIQVNMTYPADKLKVVKISTDDSSFTIQAQNQSQNGKLAIARGSLSPLTGDQLVVAIILKPLAPGDASLDFTDGTSIINASTNQVIAGALPAAVTYEIQ